MQPQEFEDAKLLWKMFYAEQCFKHAQAAAEYVLQNKIEEDNPVFYPLIAAVYVLYGRPFKNSFGVGSLGEEIIPPGHLELHRLLLKHRDRIYAHTDATNFELPDVGQANQVGVVVSPTEKRLFGTQFCARPPLLPDVINLCQSLQKKTEYHVCKLFERYVKHVPNEVGKYVINISNQAGSFFTR
ncbi:MAG TPA: hypothetical protein VMD27_12730 [Candidatus Aquilonibacter sp.]|nr:hypothetical protein [Candidatus Aquilonibacter sp.]